ncbi:MAG: GNAT family N-acetyltransferase [Candidatus Eremiobacteraeota bacterium]|nr:GNAT family N-acetyltransferase [Candidatus Eremiobacteraeota bacterium]
MTTQNAGTLWRVMQGRGLREYQDVPRYSREEFERRVAARPKRFDVRAPGRFEWLIVVAGTQAAIGWVSLRIGEAARRSAEVGYSIAAGRRGLGYAGEAVRQVVSYAFETSDLRAVEACCVPANVPSRRLLAALGFREVHVQRNSAIVRGRPVDVVLFEMPRERWTVRGRPYDEPGVPLSANTK